MNLPAILPAWVPAWVPPWAQLVLLALALLLAFALLMMPFALLGQRGRFDLLEAQLDVIHAELRMLSLRLPDAEPQRLVRPSADEAAARRPQRRDDTGGRDRSEPKLRWPPAPGR